MIKLSKSSHNYLKKQAIIVRVSFNVVQPDETFQVGPFSVMAILADHGDNSPPGSVIYIVKLLDKKIIVGWVSSHCLMQIKICFGSQIFLS